MATEPTTEEMETRIVKLLDARASANLRRVFLEVGPILPVGAGVDQHHRWQGGEPLYRVSAMKS